MIVTSTIRKSVNTRLGVFDSFGMEPEWAPPEVVQDLQAQGLAPYYEVAESPTLFRKKYVPGIIPTDRPATLLMIRFGGMGDVLWLTPVMRGLKERYPLLRIEVQCFTKDRDLLYNCPYVDAIHTGSKPTLDMCRRVDAVLDFFESVENNKAANFRHPIEFACEMAGVRPSSLLPYWKVDTIESQWADAFFAAHGVKPGQPMIGLALAASSPHRTWVYFDELISFILNEMPTVHVLMTGNMPHAVDMVKRIIARYKDSSRVVDAFGATTLRQMIGVLDRCKMVVSCDTGVVHALAGLKKPTIGIYSTVPAATRTGVYENSFSIQTAVPCSPCFKIGEPCEYGERCMTTLAPITVFQKVREVYNGLA